MDKDKKELKAAKDGESKEKKTEKPRGSLLGKLIGKVRRQIGDDHEINQLAYNINEIASKHGLKGGKVKTAMRLAESNEAEEAIVAEMVLERFKEGAKKEDYREKELKKILALKEDLVEILTLAGVEHEIVNKTIEIYFGEGDYLIAAYVNNDLLSLFETKMHLLDAINDFFKQLIEKDNFEEAIILNKLLNDYIDISDHEDTAEWMKEHLETLIEDEKYKEAEKISRKFGELFEFPIKVLRIIINIDAIMPDYGLYAVEKWGELTQLSGDIVEYEEYPEHKQKARNIKTIQKLGLNIKIYRTKKYEDGAEGIDEDGEITDTEENVDDENITQIEETPETIAYRYTKENILKDIMDGKVDVERFTEESAWEKYEPTKKRTGHLRPVK